ncbi:hypothetical protein PGTUg99_025961 [Puccinia graminis f. sp. tritici]|uniref:CRIB domain-containing protein n=1 Tax=Puccinia graminis f. sp. tritici TaxID=56615 RepID=A0A5B0NJU6_PUCGR|nr:hypothetical protein PGTUg99_025961 [Puccinia graminis f. sp. tritici]
MVAFAQPPMRKAHQKLSFSPGSHRPTEPSSGPPLSMNASKLDKLKKLWDRRPKFAGPNGGGNTTVTVASLTLPYSLSSKSKNKKQSRRTTIGTEKIGLPHDFIHSKHVGIHDVREIAYQPRHSMGAVDMLDSAGLRSSLYRLTDSEPESQSEEEKTPAAVTQRRSPQERRSLGCPGPQVPPSPRSNKVKRKSVPIHILQDVPESPPQLPSADRTGEATQGRYRFSCLSIEESVKELINYAQPESLVDEQGRPLHMVGGEYMTQTMKGKWDNKMAEIAQTLKSEAS